MGEHRKSFVHGTTRALRWGRALVVCGVFFGLLGSPLPGQTANDGADGMTVDEAAKLGEDFGVVVGEVDEEIQKELKLQRPQGVAVFEVIGNSRADYAGIKVRSVIKEIDKKEVKTICSSRYVKPRVEAARHAFLHRVVAGQMLAPDLAQARVVAVEQMHVKVRLGGEVVVDDRAQAIPDRAAISSIDAPR